MQKPELFISSSSSSLLDDIAEANELPYERTDYLSTLDLSRKTYGVPKQRRFIFGLAEIF